MTVTTFTLQGNIFTIDMQRRTLTHDSTELLKEIRRRIEYCKQKGYVVDTYPPSSSENTDNSPVRR